MSSRAKPVNPKYVDCNFTLDSDYHLFVTKVKDGKKTLSDLGPVSKISWSGKGVVGKEREVSVAKIATTAGDSYLFRENKLLVTKITAPDIKESVAEKLSGKPLFGNLLMCFLFFYFLMHIQNIKLQFHSLCFMMLFQ